MARKLAALESKYDHQFKVVFDAIRGLMRAASTKALEIMVSWLAPGQSAMEWVGMRHEEAGAKSIDGDDSGIKCPARSIGRSGDTDARTIADFVDSVENIESVKAQLKLADGR